MGDINEDGVLEGDLYIRGTGDPSLVVEKLWKMFQDLQVEGIVEIDGDIIFDDTWFDKEHLIAGWQKKVDLAAGPAYFAPISALSLNFNTVSIVVAPAMKAGELARVQLETAAEVIQIESEIATVRAGKRAWIQIEREIDPKTHVVTFTMEGDIPVGGETERHYRSVGNPVAWTMSATDELFRKTGVTMTGRFKLDETPEEAELVVHHLSQPLHELLNHTNKYSSNIMAEHILKAMGAEIKGEPGTTENGLEVVREYLDELGIPRSEYTLVNGSGLTRDASLAPSHVNAVMMDMFHHPQVAPEFMASLAVGGVDGTLRRRFDEVPGAVRGKTGSLNGVYCLTSYVRAQTGVTYAMTFFANDLRRSRPARALQDTIGESIMGWTGAMPEEPEK
jgi:D-alanyl-D-alanine carboxypeptidase/D-alanyl-D-alanine-endopeptidase (penicillin-binding protein 4)